MPRSIAVLGAGHGLGRAVAHRYAREGYAVVLVARRREPLETIAKELNEIGGAAHVVTTDLSDPAVVPELAERIRREVGNPDVLYYGPAGAAVGFASATTLTARYVHDHMPLYVDTLLALVHEFLPPMVERGDGAVLSAQGASAVRGMPDMSGPAPALAAQRNYLQSLHAETAAKGVYVGSLYIGAAIENSPFHTQMEAAREAGAEVPDMSTVDPAHLAESLWTMHSRRTEAEAVYPEGLFEY